MKLFSLPDGTVDRKDRAQWITGPFDLAFLVTIPVLDPRTVVILRATPCEEIVCRVRPRDDVTLRVRPRDEIGLRVTVRTQ